MSEAKIPNIDYTRLLTCILYEGGAADVLEELYKRGIKEGYFVSVRGAPLGKIFNRPGFARDSSDGNPACRCCCRSGRLHFPDDI